MIRSYYPHLFHGQPEQEAAEALSARTYELSEFLVDVAGATVEGSWHGKVTYHDSCHGLRELGLTGQGRELLRRIEGVELVEMARPEACCGFGGTFALRLPDVATAMADDKVDQTLATEATVMLAGDTGCLMHLSGRLSRRGAHVEAMHLATFLARAAGLVPAEAARGSAG
jgi:L-lactate dehydrogenase complex protein LldE